MREPDIPTVVLVVEDEALIRIATVIGLEDAGFTVLECDSADAAIAILERRTDINVVFSDVDMPGSMDGLKLVAYVRDRWPPIALIVASGLVKVQIADLPAGGLFIPKPYEMADVARMIETLAAAA